jgi:hypothetical protein
MRASTKMTQNGKTKTRSLGEHKSVKTRTHARIRKLASQAMKSKIWHNWLTEENPSFEVKAPTKDVDC